MKCKCVSKLSPLFLPKYVKDNHEFVCESYIRMYNYNRTLFDVDTNIHLLNDNDFSRSHDYI